MEDYTFYKTHLFGVERQFRALSGVVMHSSQRSDTHIYGGIRNHSRGPGARTPISSEIVITSNIWIKTPGGKEQKLTYKKDLEFRPGSVIHVVDVCDKKGKPITDDDVLIYNSTSKELIYGDGAYNAKVMQLKRGKKFLNSLLYSMVSVFFLNIFLSSTQPITEKLLESFSRGILFGAILSIPVFMVVCSWKRQNKAQQEIGKKFEVFTSELDKIANRLYPTTQPA